MNQVSRVGQAIRLSGSAGRLLCARGIATPKAAKDSRANLAFSLTAPEGMRLEFVEYRLDAPRLSDPRTTRATALKPASRKWRRTNIGAVLA